MKEAWEIFTKLTELFWSVFSNKYTALEKLKDHLKMIGFYDFNLCRYCICLHKMNIAVLFDELLTYLQNSKQKFSFYFQKMSKSQNDDKDAFIPQIILKEQVHIHSETTILMF